MRRLRLCAAALLAAGSGCSSPSSGPSSAGPSASPNPAAWSASASGLGVPGDRIAFACPPGGTAGTVWGDGTYTADSSVCTAAVHSGLITLKYGGSVTVEIAAGLGAYQGSTANGVTTRSYGSWSQSFVFPKAGWLSGFLGTPPASPAPTPSAYGWNTFAPGWTPLPIVTPNRIGDRRTVDCDGTELGAVWGTDIYTADSDPCRAAVHAGVLAAGASGRVTIEFVAGEALYVPTTRHGVTSSDWRSYPMSFVFPGAATAAPRTVARAMSEATLDSMLDRSLVGIGTDTWEITLYRDGTAHVSKRSARRRFNVIAKATPLASDVGSARVSITGTIYRYDSGKPVSSPITAQLVLRPAIRGVEIAEESASLGLGSEGIVFTADDE